MAFLSTQNQDEDKEQEQSGMNTISSGQGSNIAGGSSPAQGSVKGGSGQFTNIQDYIQANKPKTQGLAQGITQDVKEEATGLQDTLSKQREDYLGEQGKFGSGQQEFVTQQVQQAGQQPQSEEDIQRYRDIATGAEQAPDLTGQRQQAADLERRAKEFETSKGRFEGLQSLVGDQSATYGKGQRQLDQLLLAGDRASNTQAIKDIRGATQGIGSNVSKLQEDVTASRDALQQSAQTGASDAYANLRSSLEQEAQAMPTLLKGIESGQISQDMIDQLGLQTAGQLHEQQLRSRGLPANYSGTMDQYVQENLNKQLSGMGYNAGDVLTYGVDLNKYLQAPSVSSVAGQEDLARAQALAKLQGLGGQDIILDEGMMGSDLGIGSLQEAVAANRGQLSDAFTKVGFSDPGYSDLQKAAMLRDASAGKWYDRGGSSLAPYSQEIDRYAGWASNPLRANVKDGGIIQNPKIAALKKLRGY